MSGLSRNGAAGCAWARRPLLGRSGQRVIPLKLAACGVALVVAAAIGCAPGVKTERVDIILISLDTLRRDHVGCYLPRGDSPTPTLDLVAGEAVVFENAWVQIPFTLPSHMSMFTGLQPDVHGMEKENSVLSESIPTLPEVLQSAGYQTIGVAATYWMKGEFGFARGFDRYELLEHDLVYSERINRRTFEVLDARPDDGRPLFLFLHYFDPHSDFSVAERNRLPYFSPPEYLSSLNIDALSDDFCVDDSCATDYLLAANQRPELVNDSSLDTIRELYRAGVRYLDRDLKVLFTGLHRRGLWDGSLVIITADHGEEFREHGELIHNQPYVENMAAPLIMKLPRGALGGSRRQAVVESIDLLPTLLELVGVDVPAGIQGQSFAHVLTGTDRHREHALGRDKLTPTRYSLRTAELTLIHDIKNSSTGLYQRGSDPAELDDVADARPEDVERLKESLLARLAAIQEQRGALQASTRGESDVLTEDEQEKLRAIGYLR